VEWNEIVEDLLGSSLWFSCSKETQWFLITAESLYVTLGTEMDFSASMIEYCKAFEVELNSRVVEPLLQHIAAKVPKGYVAAGSRRVGPDYAKFLTLGAFPFLLASEWSSRVSGKKYLNPSYDKDFSGFILERLEWHYHEATIGKWMASIIQTVADYRNRAAHSEVIEKEEVSIVRQAWEEEVGGISSVLKTLWRDPCFFFFDDEDIT